MFKMKFQIPSRARQDPVLLDREEDAAENAMLSVVLVVQAPKEVAFPA